MVSELALTILKVNPNRHFGVFLVSVAPASGGSHHPVSLPPLHTCSLQEDQPGDHSGWHGEWPRVFFWVRQEPQGRGRGDYQREHSTAGYPAGNKPGGRGEGDGGPQRLVGLRWR